MPVFSSEPRERGAHDLGDVRAPLTSQRGGEMRLPRTYLSHVLILILFTSSGGLQTTASPQENGDAVAIRKSSLILDLESLNAEASKINAPLALASARVEIAGAMWLLNRARAQDLLLDAYELTLPEEKERMKLREQPAGAPPTEPTEKDIARIHIQQRILEIAGRDQGFAARLTQEAGRQLGKSEEVHMYATLAARSSQSGNMKEASTYTLRAIEADPTQLASGLSILETASRDRELADQLIVEYVNRLRSFPLSRANASRVYLSLRFAVSPNPNLDPQRRRIAPAGPAATRAYVSYVIDSLTILENREPGSAAFLRSFLLSIWPLVNQVAPDLAGAFLAVERASRVSGEEDSIPTMTQEETYTTAYEQRVKNAYKTRNQRDLVEAIDYALGRGDFSEARGLIDLLPDEKLKAQNLEELNTRESVDLAAHGELTAAENLARRLELPKSILRAYPAVISKCVAKKNPVCTTGLSLEAVKRLKRADDMSNVPRALGELAKTVAPADAMLALEFLDEVVRAVNSSQINTDNGEVGFDADLFEVLAARDEGRASQSAAGLKDRLQRIAALAAVYKWKANNLITSRAPQG